MPKPREEGGQQQDEEHVYMNPTGHLPGEASGVREASEEPEVSGDVIPDAAPGNDNRLHERVVAVENGFRSLSITVLTLGLICVVCITALWVYIADSGFRNATFTTLGTTGRAGPTSLGDHYRGQDHEKLVTLQNGIQLFTVPDTGNYQIEVAGAAGGWDSTNSNENYRGYGAMMKGTFKLRQENNSKLSRIKNVVEDK
uniref:receptor protein-tyrosine kinase n=1 Tax=Branchiostoma floridae TaxID=7739 RepID=C3ZKD0_BRAFL|eukprot:XP_002591018.1 hypothetical protein BRAFLDRAFT_69429 [Branchiostoma floridae]